jgi:hypothetical protein
MRTLIPWLLVLWLSALAGDFAWAQPGRYVPPPRFPPGGGHFPGGGGHFPGGGGHFPGGVHSPSQGSGSDAEAGWVVLGVVGVVVIGVVGWCVGKALGGGYAQRQQRCALTQPPDLIRSRVEVARKARETTELLDSLAARDPLFKLSSLGERVERVFWQVQKCWQERNYDPVKDLLMPGIFAEHQLLLASMRQHREINRIEAARIERLEFVHLDCPSGDVPGVLLLQEFWNNKTVDLPVRAHGGQEFTVLITFQASIYFVDDRTSAHTRGSREPRLFQEFWVFRRESENWKLQAIEQSRESTRLETENRVAETFLPIGTDA